MPTWRRGRVGWGRGKVRCLSQEKWRGEEQGKSLAPSPHLVL